MHPLVHALHPLAAPSCYLATSCVCHLPPPMHLLIHAATVCCPTCYLASSCLFVTYHLPCILSCMWHPLVPPHRILSCRLAAPVCCTILLSCDCYRVCYLPPPMHPSHACCTLLLSCYLLLVCYLPPPMYPLVNAAPVCFTLLLSC